MATHEGLNKIYPTRSPVDQIINKTIPIRTDAEFERLVQTNKSGNAYVMRKYLAKHMINKHYNKQLDRSHYHLMTNCLLSLPEVYLAEAGSPYIDYINELLGLFHAHGFFVYWWKQAPISHSADGDLGGNGEGDKKVDESEIKVVITLDHMKAAFCLWGIGISLATTMFVSEVVRDRFTRFKNRNKVTILNELAAREYGCFYD